MYTSTGHWPKASALGPKTCSCYCYHQHVAAPRCIYLLLLYMQQQSCSCNNRHKCHVATTSRKPAGRYTLATATTCRCYAPSSSIRHKDQGQATLLLLLVAAAMLLALVSGTRFCYVPSATVNATAAELLVHLTGTLVQHATVVACTAELLQLQQAHVVCATPMQPITSGHAPKVLGLVIWNPYHGAHCFYFGIGHVLNVST